MRPVFRRLPIISLQLDVELIPRTFGVIIGGEQQCLEFVAPTPEVV